jgi:2-polyprenyl-3-methyl-5-hydroxy-6-metoxy-1,4-benzoquinol methylase
MDEPQLPAKSVSEWPELAGETQSAWDQNAGFWDEKFGDGNAFHNALVGPTAERLLALTPGEAALDVACGNGAFARRLAALGARVTACDISQAFLERARAHATPAGLPIEYHPVDATNRAALLALGARRFDAAVCNMALMDMPAIEPLFESLPRLLKPGGRFVFTLLHPCFNSVYVTKVIEEDDRGGTLNTAYALKQTGYITPTASKGIGIIGQPVAQTYFHRPISVYLQAAFRAGFVLDGCEEPVFPEDVEPNRPLAWQAFREFPPVFAARVHLV